MYFFTSAAVSKMLPSLLYKVVFLVRLALLTLAYSFATSSLRFDSVLSFACKVSTLSSSSFGL